MLDMLLVSSWRSLESIETTHRVVVVGGGEDSSLEHTFIEYNHM